MNLKLSLPNGRTLKVRANFPFDTSPIGYRALIKTPQGGRTAIVVGLADEGQEVELEFPDERPITTEKHLRALIETARHYALLPWKLLFDLLPSPLNWEEEEFITLRKKEWEFVDKKSIALLEYVKSRRKVKEESLKEKFGKDVVERLINLGFLEKVREWKHPDLTETFYRLSVSPEEAIEKLRRLKNKEEKIRLIYYVYERLIVSKEELREAGFKRADIRHLVEKNILIESEEELKGVKPPTGMKQVTKTYLKPLGRRSVVFGSWERVLERLLWELDKVVGEGKSAFLFCDSLQLLKSLEELIYPVLGDRLLSISSYDKPKEFIRKWSSLHSFSGVLLGSRLALLAPFQNVELLICFGSEPYRHHDGIDLRYYLYELSQYYGASFVVASHMPPLSLCIREDWQKEYYQPEAEVHFLHRKANQVLTEEAKSMMEEEGEYLFLVNKAGYSYAFCAFCGWIVECPRCKTFLTLSKDKDRVFCTSCGYKSEANCPECGRPLQELGFGVEKAIEEITKAFGKRHNFHFDTVPRFGKSYDYVFVLHADNILSVPWFDSLERYFSYLWQALCVSKKRLVVQTVFEENPLKDFIKAKDWQAFCEEELQRRREEGLPPFKRLIKAKLKSLPDLQNLPAETKKRNLGSLWEVLIKVEKAHFSKLLKELRKYNPVDLEVI
ncbi:MAG: hypothetical protein RMI50_03645 [Aquificaceae bacterium]|nr:hypothetical protein [Aquificaceae bacterium]